MCNRAFDDLTNTMFSGHHQPLSVGMLWTCEIITCTSYAGEIL
jgi:hypothetical protein